MTEPTPDQNVLRDGIDPAAEPTAESASRPRRLSSRLMMLLRRIHLYAGLFLLPWVLLYGITGAMFNHQGLFPEVHIQPVPVDVLSNSSMNEFPAPAEFARQVAGALQAASNGATITLAENHQAEFTNDIQFEIRGTDRHVVQIDPMQQAAKVVTHPENSEQLERMLKGVHQIQLQPDPHEAARNSVATILNEVGIETTGHAKPLGWTKLNFLAHVNGDLARVTYVLKDGHVDVMKYTGEDGMSPRQFFMRLHTSHGQPPHWNGRRLWSLVIDAMAIAMVTWALTGLLMWWQIKRTRFIGAVVIAASLATAILLYLNMQGFYEPIRKHSFQGMKRGLALM